MDLAGADRSLAGDHPRGQVGLRSSGLLRPGDGRGDWRLHGDQPALEAEARARADAETRAAEIEARVQTEVKARARAEARIRALEAELKRLGNGPPGD